MGSDATKCAALAIIGAFNKNERMPGISVVSFLGRSLRDLSEARGSHLRSFRASSSTKTIDFFSSNY
jgi:hypothetical protein